MPLIERRKKQRSPVKGEVRLVLAEPPAIEVHGRLIDAGDEAFRAAHHYTALRAGQEVRFHHSTTEGIARVIWNRILGTDVESGFLVLKG